jgi:hypothetical protein
MRELADWTWWRIAQAVFALTLLPINKGGNGATVTGSPYWGSPQYGALSEVGGGKIVVAGLTTAPLMVSEAPAIGMA